MEYLPEQSVSILTLNNDALVVPWADILRVARVQRTQTTSGRFVDPSKRRALDTATLPMLMVIGAGYINGFLSYGNSSFASPGMRTLVGWGKGLNGVIAARIGRTKYLGVTTDYLWASFQAGIDPEGAERTGTASFWSIGPSLSFDAAGMWFTGTLSYLHQRYDWDTPRGYPPGHIPAETNEGVRLQTHVIIPVTTFVGLHSGARFDIAGSFQPSLMFGLSFCNFMDLLYHNNQ